MSFLKKLFGSSKKPIGPQQKTNPDNTRLIYLLNNWADNRSDENYKTVLDEIQNGNSYLLLPSVNEDRGSGTWETATEQTTLKLTSVFDLDGLKVLAVFSDEKALLEWAKEESQYTAMRAQDTIEFCRANNIDRIVINTDQQNMFVLERNRENINTTTIEKDTEVLVGTPIRPLGKNILDKLVASFEKVETIEEAYQYAQNRNGESSLVLGIKLSVVSDNSRAALHNALNNALSDEQLDTPLDIMVLETEDWLNTVRTIQNSLFYKR